MTIFNAKGMPEIIPGIPGSFEGVICPFVRHDDKEPGMRVSIQADDNKNKTMITKTTKTKPMTTKNIVAHKDDQK